MFGSICSSYCEIQQSPWLNPSCFLEGTARPMCYFRDRDFNVVNFPPEQLIYLTFASDRFCYTQKSVCIRMWLSKRKKERKKKEQCWINWKGPDQSHSLPDGSFILFLAATSHLNSKPSKTLLKWERQRQAGETWTKLPGIYAFIVRLLSLVTIVYSPPLTSPVLWSPVWMFLKVPAWLKLKIPKHGTDA